MGSKEQRILDNGHDRLSTYGLLKEAGKQDVRGWIEQLVGQGFLERVGEYQTLQLTATARAVLKGEVIPRLLRPAEKKARRTSNVETNAWEGVDKGLFEELRSLRRQIADAKNLQSFMVFSDASVRDMARRRPTTIDAFHQVNGVGDKKSADYGAQFVQCIVDYCTAQGLATDVGDAPAKKKIQSEPGPRSIPPAELVAYDLFQQRLSIADIAAKINRAPSTIGAYLQAYIETEQITDPTPWVSPETHKKIIEAAHEAGLERLKPIKDILGDAVTYDEIRISVTCLNNLAKQT